MAPISMTLCDLKPRFQGHDIIQRQITRTRYKIRSGHSLTLNISEMAKDTAIVTMEGE